MSSVKSYQDDKVVLEIDGQEIPLHLGTLFDIDDTQLSAAFSKQPSFYGRISVLTARAEAVYQRAKFQCERVYAQSDLGYRDEFTKSGTKFTEGTIKSCVSDDDEYVIAKNAELDAEELWKMLRSILYASQQRAEMLISLGAHQRAEMSQTGMYIKEQEYDDLTKKAREAVKEARNRKS